MATITTTIKEPKTFQQIQDEQTQLGKEKTLEDLNSNIVKLTQAINKTSEKQLTDEEKKLKSNQLELSKLQLQRAQLGLAHDQKRYSDYSQKYDKTHGVGSSIGVDQNTRDNTTAVALSAVTGGMLNPVVVKQVLLPPLKIMTNAVGGIVKALAPNRRVSGKSSSATEDNEGKKLNKKLDDILGAIKNKTTGSKSKDTQRQSFFSKALGFISGIAGTVGSILVDALKGAIGAYLAIKLGEKIGPWVKEMLAGKIGDENADVLVNTMQAYLPSMAAGLAIAGWKGAVAGLAVHLLGEATDVIQTKVKGPTLIDVGAEKLNDLLKPLGITLSTEQFKGVVGGFALAGPKGALLGLALGTESLKNAVSTIKNYGFGTFLKEVDLTVEEYTKGTPLENVSSETIEGAIAGGLIGSKFGIKGLLIGALLGAAGGFVWDRIKNKNIPRNAGINTEFDFSRMNWVISGTNKTFDDFRKPYIGEINPDTGKKYTAEEIEAYALSDIKAQVKSGEIKNEQKSLVDKAVEGIAGISLPTLDPKELGEKAYDCIKSLGEKLFDAGVKLGESVFEWIHGEDKKDDKNSKNLTQRLRETAWKAVKGIAEGLFAQGEKFGEDIFNWVQNGGPEKVVDWVKGVGKEGVEWVKGVGEEGVEWVKEKALSIWNTIKENVNKVFDYIKNIPFVKSFLELFGIKSDSVKNEQKTQAQELAAKGIGTDGKTVFRKKDLTPEQIEEAKQNGERFYTQNSKVGPYNYKETNSVPGTVTIVNQRNEEKIEKDRIEEKEQQIENNKINERTAVATEKLVQMMEKQDKEKQSEVFDTSSDSSNVGYSDVLATGSFDSLLMNSLVK